MGLQRQVKELRAQDVAQRVPLERATDGAAIPVHILQHAVAVVWRSQSKIGLEALAPGLRQVAHGQVAFEQT